MIELTIPLAPRPKGNSKHIAKRGDRTFLVGSTVERKHQEQLAMLARAQCTEAPLLGPVVLDVTFVFAVPSAPASASRLARARHEAWVDRALRGIEVPDGTIHSADGPVADLTNLSKMVEDGLAGICYPNDRAIVEHRTRRAWGSEGAYVIRARGWMWVSQEIDLDINVLDHARGDHPTRPTARAIAETAMLDALDGVEDGSPEAIALALGTGSLSAERDVLASVEATIAGDERRIVVACRGGLPAHVTAALARLGWRPAGGAGMGRWRFVRP